MKLCALYIRVSTERQAKVEEGSLKTQDHLLAQHVEIKDKIGPESWRIVDRYADEGKSAKDTKGRPEYQRMIADINAGRINTVVCTALSRISRSTRDLLDMVEFFKQKNVDFICLKEDFDTTTAQGKCFITIMGALNEFEREQTSERTHHTMLARAERGLWNGGQIVGYEIDPAKKGQLVINEKEAESVRFAFDTYLVCGSILETAKQMNAHGYRSKSYTSRNSKVHLPLPFGYTSTHQMLSNLAYVGKKEVNKGRRRLPQESLSEDYRYRLVPAAWPAIISEEQFNKVQHLIRINHKQRGNALGTHRRFYLLNGGLLQCAVCKSRMEGHSAYGRLGQRYYYYSCQNSECRFKIPQEEAERAARELVVGVLREDRLLEKIVHRTNELLLQELPKLLKQRQERQQQLATINAQAQKIMDEYLDKPDFGPFVKDRLSILVDQRSAVEKGLATLSQMVDDIEQRTIDRTLVEKLLKSFDEVFGEDLKPYQRRELLQRVLQRIQVSDREIRAAVKVHRPSPDGNIVPIHQSDVGSSHPSGEPLKWAALFLWGPPIFMYNSIAY